MFSTRYDARRDPQPFGHTDWKSEITAATKVDGTIGDSAPDKGYTAEIKIPWSSFATGAPPAALPKEGQTWRANFFVMDAREQGQRAVGWSAPKVGDFHTLHRFGTIRFGLPTVNAKVDAVHPGPGVRPHAMVHAPPAQLLGQSKLPTPAALNAKDLPPSAQRRLLERQKHKPAPGETVPTAKDPISKTK